MKISIESKNLYYSKGLEFLIKESLSENTIKYFLSVTDDITEADVINITLRDSSISINLFEQTKKVEDLNPNNKKSTIHIPFVCKNRKITDIKWIIEKAFFIASLDKHEFINDDFYRITGLKKHEQLSLTETKIMLLIGNGNNVNFISRQLRRSEKTITVHYRNASRKMKLNNKAEFYNYAKFIVSCQRNERKTVCL